MAISAPPLMGYAHNDVTATRAVDTAYQNTSGALMFVIVSSHGASNAWGLEGRVEDANPPTVAVMTMGGGLLAIRDVGTLVVPTGWYYGLWDTGGAALASINHWIEVHG